MLFSYCSVLVDGRVQRGHDAKGGCGGCGRQIAGPLANAVKANICFLKI
jgi:hypothetical protein